MSVIYAYDNIEAHSVLLSSYNNKKRNEQRQ